MCSTNRMCANAQYNEHVEPMPSLHSKIEVLTQEKESVGGVIVTVAKYVPDDSETRFDGIKATDFALSNLLDAEANLQPAVCSLRSFEAVGYAASQFERISQSVATQSKE